MPIPVPTPPENTPIPKITSNRLIIRRVLLWSPYSAESLFLESSALTGPSCDEFEHLGFSDIHSLGCKIVRGIQNRRCRDITRDFPSRDLNAQKLFSFTAVANKTHLLDL